MDPAKSRILLDESVLADRIGVDQERLAVLKDFQMLAILNAKERTEEQWRELVRAADERLVVEKSWQEGSAAGMRNAIIEVRLRV
jgi:hypothetical protein